ncbi:acylphosphatase [Kiloniella antarctica]|uniref:acylphosphatase n=1 Tax=Kiloniella antarctica TaxID=1550907 RepID=A0ABW5BKQ4_9PROT
MKQIRVLITGRVQGVWYRGWTVTKATELGIKGWVRNLSSGQVEAVFVGEKSTVEAMVVSCWQGPDLAKVKAVETFEDTSELEGREIFVQIR